MTDIDHLIDEVRRSTAAGQPFDLWVPDTVMVRGHAAPAAIVIAIIGDAVLAADFRPDGYVQGHGGRRYRYTPWAA